ncbi:hypothetical protein EDEG_05090, partial [Edhazardia aedis USNM 41457]
VLYTTACFSGLASLWFPIVLRKKGTFLIPGSINLHARLPKNYIKVNTAVKFKAKTVTVNKEAILPTTSISEEAHSQAQ